MSESKMEFTRQSPSPRYVEMLDLYKRMHRHGDTRNNVPPEKTFDGHSLGPHVQTITRLLGSYGARSLTDYGCGKAIGYTDAVIVGQDGKQHKGLLQYWAPVAITLYDPGNPLHDAYPEKQTDVVISTDVLEHIPAEDIPWVLDSMFSLARRFVYLSIACYAAAKSLPSGENAHITQKSPGWWLDQIEAAAIKHGRMDYHGVIYATRNHRIELGCRNG